ncbi:MAG TPA: sigma-70 family RNA polymerase sigma factor [Prolixibacteraceae bacterium]|jgi:RNA polymerase sigma-70 factor (ECF subfamily)|nr:sigma-70 family RNA polymerase sigma factor [Prolixibacteraceae bacterium]HOY50158.1 sigma-70 family RNA polymerase sigma factor [Prolixibacteraceae bacterium]HPJ79052.1 sigma-70 family RNA polymerase sigma factor [Prolixibacteraceae bacterium]HRV90074.1 sigma-70 family RNA polymerase sigma factor [Prolixibacteraceae bacterium]
MTTEEFKSRLWPYTRKLYPMMKRILGSEEETRDALQELMLRLWNRKEALEECLNPDAYIFTAARNYCFDQKKRERRSPVTLTGEVPVQVAGGSFDPDAAEKLKHVRLIMGSLPENYREVLEMREIDGLSFEEIAELTGNEVPYIRVLLSRSRMKLRNELEKIYSYERGTGQTA